MINVAAKFSRFTRRRTALAFSICKPPSPFLTPQAPPPPWLPTRFFSTNWAFKANPVAVHTINYAYSLARSQRTDDSYGQGLLILEQCEINQTSDNSKGLVLLAMSKLLSERGNFEEAIEKLGKILELNVPEMDVGVIVAASEALTSLYLELGLDDAASAGEDAALVELGAPEIESGSPWMDIYTHSRASKGLIELVRGNRESSGKYLKETLDSISSFGNTALSYAEFLHTMRNFTPAKELYQKVSQGVPGTKEDDTFAADGIANLPWEDVSIGATFALGQLETHMGNFAEAEEILTRALTKTEEHFGSHHPRVGVVLTSIALMFRHKSIVERSSSLVIQEGLFRRAIELLKAPPLETSAAEMKACRRDIIALARGGYAETLCLQQNRKAEGERMKNWANATWGNRRLSLVEALNFSEPSSNVPVIDARISRVL